MLKKFLHGLAFGAGFAIAMILVMSLGSWGVTTWSARSRVGPIEVGAEVFEPPAPSQRFLGSLGTYSGDFNTYQKGGTLTAGPGRIVGRVSSNGNAVEGLTLRLALNGSVMSAWATTDAQGTYSVAVPFGHYRVDGYELNFETANRVLAGKADHPSRMSRNSTEFDVGPDAAGEGLTLRFVDPVVILGPAGTVSSRDPVVVAWAPYPGAERYRVQLVVARSPDDYTDRENVFDRRSPPEVASTSLDLAANGVTLKNGYYYMIEIEARDAESRAIASSVPRYAEADFRVVD